MATSCLRSALLKSSPLLTDAVLYISPASRSARQALCLCQLALVRHGSFFNRKNEEQQWDSITSVSNQGRRRGRASRGKIMKRVNLSAGVNLGQGKSGLVFPGLSSTLTGKEHIQDLGVRKQVDQEEKDEGRQSKLQKDKSTRKLDPLDRGYHGSRLPGRKVDPPDPVDDYEFSDFKAYCIESKLVGTVTASYGTVMSSQVLVATGNGKGLIGIALGKASTSTGALKSARNKAAQQLVYVDRFEGHTILHNFAEKYHRTKVIAYPAPVDHGLCCHPVIKILCELIGIKNIYVVSEGNVRNYLNLCRAFLTGVLKTKTHQEIADQLGHHIVEYRLEHDNYPVVKASPSENAKHTDFKKEDGFDYESYCFGNRLPLKKPSRKPFYWKMRSFKDKMYQEYKRRHQSEAAINRMVLGLQQEYKRTK